MIPAPRTPEDILTIVKQRHRWRLPQRILALRAANKRITILRMSKKIDGEQAANLRAQVLPLLRRAQQRKAQLDGQQVRATPDARDLAAELKVDLAAIAGTGQDGRILKRDVRAYVT